MVSGPVVKFGWCLVGLVVGAAVAVGIMELVLNMTVTVSSDEDDVSNSTGTRVQDTLQFVLFISRHGNRGGSFDYPGDPYPLNDTTLWPYGANGLTTHGRVQEYNLGLKIRSMYNGFLPTTFRSKDIHASSTTIERAILSGDMVLAGIYPPSGWQVWNSSIHWQPIPLYTNLTEHTEDLSSCESFQLDRASSKVTLAEQDAANISLMTSYLYNQTGENFTIIDLYYLFDKLISEDNEGYTLPDWTQAIYPEPLTDYTGKFLRAIYAGTDKMVKLYIGERYEDLLDTLSSKANGLSEGLVVYYSAHDTTIVSLRAALRVEDAVMNELVKTGSALILELHKESNSSAYSVELLYLDGSSLDSGPVSLSLPYCGDPCYLDSLINSTQMYTNFNYTAECQTTNASTLSQSLYML